MAHRTQHRDEGGSTYPCGTCGGGGLVPPPGCTCNSGNTHHCTPVTCPRCNGVGWLTSKYGKR